MKKSELKKIIREELKKKTLDESTMTIFDFNNTFLRFYSAISKYSKYMDDDTKAEIKNAIKFLDKAWENESHSHGVEWTKFSVKL